MKTHKKLILASSSPRRQALFRSLDLSFEIVVSHANEEVSSLLSPEEIVKQLSQKKAQAVFETVQKSDAVIVAADTIVVLDGQVLGKPTDEQDAKRMLSQLEGKEHHVFSGITCLDCSSKRVLTNHRMSKVTMKSLSEEKINRYIETGEPKDKAGSYAIQGFGATLIEKIEGDYFNIVGLSLSLLSDMLEEFNISII